MRVAAIDLGTNSLLLLVAEQRGGKLESLCERCQIVRLGEGVDKTGQLDAAAMTRTLQALERFAGEIRHLGVDRVGAVGTQALREAKNGEAFLERACRTLGVVIEVIRGSREAELSWRAVATSFPLPRRARRTVIDIGGGSTEVMVGGADLEQVASVRMGSVRLTERLLHHDPPTHEECEALGREIDRGLEAVPHPEGELVGVAGTVTTLCAIGMRLADYDGARVHGARLRRKAMADDIERLGKMPLSERRRVPGLDPRRADVIYAGGMILQRLMERAGIEELLVSDRGIRWGLAEELLSR